MLFIKLPGSREKPCFLEFFHVENHGLDRVFVLMDDIHDVVVDFDGKTPFLMLKTFENVLLKGLH